MAQTPEERRENNRIRCKARYAAHRAEYLARQKAYSAANRESERLRAAAWRVAHPEQAKALCKSWRGRNVEQAKAISAKWRTENADRHRASARAYYWDNVDAERVKRAERRTVDSHKEQARIKTAAWRAENLDRARAACRAYSKANPGVVNALAAKRHNARISATPAWANLDEIAAIYRAAVRLTSDTGTPYEVDHIVPLQGKTVCGLHVEYNLQILTKTANRKKRNHYLRAVSA